MNLQCPNCNTSIPAQNINMRAMAALCPQCSLVFKFAAQPVQSKRLKRKFKAPEEIKIYQVGDWMEILIPWKKMDDRPWLFGGFFMLGIILLGLMIDQQPLLVFCIAPVFGLIGIGFVFLGYIQRVNKTSFVITPETLMISYRPISFAAPRIFNTNDIHQLYCKQIIESKGGASFQLRALTHDDDWILLENLPEHYALYLEQILEDHLGIEDIPVRGEY